MPSYKALYDFFADRSRLAGWQALVPGLPAPGAAHPGRDSVYEISNHVLFRHMPVTVGPPPGAVNEVTGTKPTDSYRGLFAGLLDSR